MESKFFAVAFVFVYKFAVPAPFAGNFDRIVVGIFFKSNFADFEVNNDSEYFAGISLTHIYCKDDY